MSAATQTKNDKAQRDAQLETYASTIRGENGKIRDSLEVIGRTLNLAAGLYAANEQDKWTKWSTLVTGWSFSRVKNVMRGAEILDEMSTGTRESVSSWTLDAVHQLSSAVVNDDEGEQDDAKTDELRAKIAAQVKPTSPTPEQVRDVRDKVTGNTRRETSEDERNGKLADKISDDLRKFLAQPQTRVSLLMKGAALQSDNRGDVAAAIAIVFQRIDEENAAAAAVAENENAAAV